MNNGYDAAIVCQPTKSLLLIIKPTSEIWLKKHIHVFHFDSSDFKLRS